MFNPIWPADHPANHQEEIEHKETPEWMTRVQNAPAMRTYLPEEEKANGTAVLILPGGGYGGVSLKNEGYPVAEWFQERGVAAFILKYRCGGGQNQQPAPLEDAQRAMQLIAECAQEHGYRADRIGVIGFSAGGHLASCVSTMAGDDDPKAAFAVLVYPVISMEFQTAHAGSRKNLLGKEPSDELVQRYTTWKHVNETTPPTLLIHSSDDKAVTTEHPILYYQQLIKHKVPAELHIFARGGHGYGLMPGERSFRKWPELMERWLKERALLNEPK
ncbi:MAG: alpha/beta hydrolase [Lacipirellulaceae bacterium]